MDKLLDHYGDRCKEVRHIDGFPYLRGNQRVLKLASKLTTKYANHKWLELLRRIDLQARYLELSALPKEGLEKFCQKAGINCIQGRIRAYVARCSAIIMGDEKTNHDFMKLLKKRSLQALNRKANARLACFEDQDTLDGLTGDDSLSDIFSPASKGYSSGFLQKRRLFPTSGKPY